MGMGVRGLSKRFDGIVALAGVDLSVGNGELLALLGPSGSGQTTPLRISAGLEQPDAGTLRIADRDALGLPPRARHTGFVFQHHPLFRHMTVVTNVALAPPERPRSDATTPSPLTARVQE